MKQDMDNGIVPIDTRKTDVDELVKYKERKWLEEVT